MTTLQEALPCPFCGKQHTLQVISGQELMDENQEFWQHSESFGVVCDASTPDGKGGCGAMGGFKPTEDEAIEAWNTRTALAQHEADKPFQPDWTNYRQGVEDGKAEALAQQGAQQVCADCGIPAGDVHMSTCKSGKWPSRVSNGDTAAPAPVAQQVEQAKPAAYITDTEQGPMVWTPEMYDEACTYCDDGEFPMPLYTAAPAPQAQPMTDPCKTCSHFKEGNLPGVRIHDETCYECRSYWGNKWEAA